VRRICNSTDPHFNDIPLKEWDAIIGFEQGQTTTRPTTDLGLTAKLQAAGDSATACSLTCILKEAARQVRDIQTD